MSQDILDSFFVRSLILNFELSFLVLYIIWILVALVLNYMPERTFRTFLSHPDDIQTCYGNLNDVVTKSMLFFNSYYEQARI